MKNKNYPIHKSPFYKLASRKKLCKLLFITESSLEKLLEQHTKFYNTFPILQNNKERRVESPKPKLKTAHKRINKLFAKIERPSWVKSCKGGGYIPNAICHKDDKYFLSCDIKSFYMNASSQYAFKVFKNEFLMDLDVARILSILISYEEHLPTGSPSSQILSFWMYTKTFTELYQLAQKHNIEMTLYVDDLTFSSKAFIPRTFIRKIKLKLEKVGLSLNEKTKFHDRDKVKVITGCAITPNRKLSVPYKNRAKIRVLKNKKELTDKEKLSLKGMIRSAKQIDPQFYIP